MNILPRNIYVIGTLISTLFLVACSGESSQSSTESSSNLALARDTPVAYVERSINQATNENRNQFEQARFGSGQTPLELYSPYHFNPGAKLYERSGIDIDAVSNELLSDYFQSSVYDVKDLNVSPDGRKLVFAAHGPITHPTDYTWNIYEYSFDTKAIRRIIADDDLANEGRDTNPVYTIDGNIIFSSDRAAGNPDSPVPNFIEVEDEDFCHKIGPKEDPSLLHSMSNEGEDILQLTYGINHDTHPTTMKDGRIAFIRWSYTYDIANNCSAPSLSKSTDELLRGSSSSPSPFGMARPTDWSVDIVCEYAESTPIGSVIASNNYTLLRITQDGQSIEQLYKTVEIEPSDEQFVFLDRIVQGENGRLVAILKHKFNESLGGNLLELQSPSDTSFDGVFANVAPRSLVDGGVALYPGQLSRNGWYSAVWPYRDGSSRYLVSWSQCLTEGEVNSFCEDVIADNGVDSRYGLWVYDAKDNSRLPIVNSETDRVFDDVVMARPHEGLEFPYEPYNSDYVDNLDTSQIICNFPPEPENVPPVANAGADQSVNVDTTVSLDGSQSSDSEDQPLIYTWSIVDQPSDAAIALSDSNSVNPTFLANRVGTYTFQLVVSDGELSSNIDTVTINATVVESVNEAPIADAGEDKETFVGVPVTLDGSGSDADGDAITYQWNIVSPDGASSSVFSSTTAPSPTFTVGEVGIYIASLVVSDGELNSAPDTVSIVVNNPNRAPTADAGVDRQVSRGDIVILNGAGSSDPDNDTLSYQWTLVSPENVSLSNANTATPSITATEYGIYVVSLVVSDGELTSESDTVNIEVINARPVANAGDDTTYDSLQNVELSGLASFDPEGEPLSYSWSLVQSPDGSSIVLNNSATSTPSFVPDVSGVYVVRLVVNDGLLDSEPDQVSITINNVPNNAPVANAGPDQQISIGGSFTLDGTGSTDSDGDPLTYSWTIISPDTGAVLNDAASARPVIDINEYGSYVVQLIVNDGKIDSEPDTVSLEFENVRPVADAGSDQSVPVGSAVSLDGSNSADVNGDVLTYSWQILSRPDDSTTTLINTDTAFPSLITDQQGNYIVQLVVNDGSVDSDPDTVVISSPNVAPIADAGDDSSVSLGGSAQLDGTRSSDPDNDPLTYQWALLNIPESSQASLVVPTSSTPTLQGVDVYGDYVVQLIVNDGSIESVPDTVTISSRNLAPIANAGDDLEIGVNVAVSLDGTGSSDPEGDPLTYTWSLVSVPEGSNATLSASNSATPQITADLEGTYIAQLMVSDGLLDSEPDTIIVRAGKVACVINDVNERTFPVIIRDFTVDHPDFQYDANGIDLNGFDSNIVREDLGDDGLPVYANGDEGSLTTSGPTTFNQWYRNTPTVNLAIPVTLTMTRLPGSNEWTFSDDEFFPIDDDLLADGAVSWGNTPIAVTQGYNHNYHFTLETHLEFDYQGGEVFTFTGDDDLWVFINGKRAINLGGIHGSLSSTIDLDASAEYLGIEPGNRYSFDLFFAERHLTRSNFHFETNINLDCVTHE